MKNEVLLGITSQDVLLGIVVLTVVVGLFALYLNTKLLSES